MLGADISFGFLNKLPMRKVDIANMEQRAKIAEIFGTLANKESQSPMAYKASESKEDSDDSEEFEDLGIFERPTEPVEEKAPESNT